MFELLSDHGIAQLPQSSHQLEGITPLQDKVQAVSNFTLPESQRDTRHFIRLMTFYYHFLHHCAEIMHSKSQMLMWNEPTRATFDATKEALANFTLLSYHMADAPTCVVTDASDIAVGGILQQHSNGTWCPISVFPRS